MDAYCARAPPCDFSPVSTIAPRTRRVMSSEQCFFPMMPTEHALVGREEKLP